MSDRYRKVRRALRAVGLFVRECETLPNRAARRQAMYGSRMQQLVEAYKESKRHVAR